MVERIKSKIKQRYWSDMMELQYGRNIISDWIKNLNYSSSGLRILDIGIGRGNDLLNIKNNLINKDVDLYGIETYPPYVKICKKKELIFFK